MEVAPLGNFRPPSSYWGNGLAGRGCVRAVWVLYLCKIPLRSGSAEREWTPFVGMQIQENKNQKAGCTAFIYLFIYFTQLRNMDQWRSGSTELAKMVKSSLLALSPRGRCALEECKAGVGKRSCPHAPSKFQALRWGSKLGYDVATVLKSLTV